MYYICNESALNELRSSWGLGAQEGSTNGQEDLEKALDKLLEGDFDVDAVQKWIKVSDFNWLISVGVRIGQPIYLFSISFAGAL